MDSPLGAVVAHTDGQDMGYVIVAGRDTTLPCDGRAISADDYPELVSLFKTLPPRFSWLHPVRYLRQKRRYAKGYRYVYGGSLAEGVNLPDLRGRLS